MFASADVAGAQRAIRLVAAWACLRGWCSNQACSGARALWSWFRGCRAPALARRISSDALASRPLLILDAPVHGAAGLWPGRLIGAHRHAPRIHRGHGVRSARSLLTGEALQGDLGLLDLPQLLERKPDLCAFGSSQHHSCRGLFGLALAASSWRLERARAEQRSIHLPGRAADLHR